MIIEKRKELSAKVFKDPNLDREFKLKGFVTLPFLNQKEIDQCLDFYNRFHPPAQRRHVATYLFPPTVVRHVSSFIENLYTPKVDRLLNNYQHIIGAFHTKPAGDPSSGRVMHHDWNVVDENKSVSVQIWCPLVDTHLQNGPFELVPMSHLLGGLPRGQGIPQYFDRISVFLEEGYHHICHSKAGEAVFFDSRIYHGSPKPNLSDQVRVAVAAHFAPKCARLVHYFSPQIGWIQLFEVPRDFISDFREGEYPKGMKLIRTLQERPKMLTHWDLENSGWLKRFQDMKNMSRS